MTADDVTSGMGSRLASVIVDIRQFPIVIMSVDAEARVLHVPVDELERTLAELALPQNGELIAFADAGMRPWWHRLLGAKRYVQTCFQFRWQGDWAALAFSDHTNAECVAISEASNGSDERSHPEYPLPMAIAFRALNDYFRTGKAPVYLSYRVVR